MQQQQYAAGQMQMVSMQQQPQYSAAAQYGQYGTPPQYGQPNGMVR